MVPPPQNQNNPKEPDKDNTINAMKLTQSYGILRLFKNMSLRTTHFGDYSVLRYTLCNAASNKLLPRTNYQVLTMTLLGRTQNISHLFTACIQTRFSDSRIFDQECYVTANLN